MTSESKLDIVLEYAKKGWRLFPVRNKKPITPHGLLDATTNVETLTVWFKRPNPSLGVGLATGSRSGVLVLDVDLYKPGAPESLAVLQKLTSFNDVTLTSVSGRGGHHYFYKYPSGGNVPNAQEFMGLFAIDIRGEGGYVVLPPSPHESGQEYAWLGGHSPADLDIAECPEFILRPLNTSKTKKTVSPITIALSGVKPPGANGKNAEGETKDPTKITEGLRNTTLTSIAGTLRNFGMEEEAIFQNLRQVNQARCVPPLPDEELKVIAHHITEYPPNRNRAGIGGDITNEAAMRMLTFDHNDAGFGEMISFFHGTNIRYNHTRASWLIWQGNFWVPDAKNEIALKAIEVADTYKAIANNIPDEAVRADTLKYARQLKNKTKLDAALYIAAAQPGLATVHSDWDHSPHLVATLNGVIDLRNGNMRRGVPDDKISQWVNVHHDPSAKPNLWLSFLRDIFGNDDSLIRFAQKAVGYSLTGEIREQCLFLLVGKGSNGKTTFLEILRMIFGNYSFTAPFATFERSNNAQQQSNDLAAIANKRLVMASEPNEGIILNEGRIKSLTGGEAVSARFLHHEFFEFIPMCKIWLAGNSLPRVVDDSYGFWRRVRMIKFLQSFVTVPEGGELQPGQKLKDPSLISKLLQELPGILNWVIEGAILWYAEGLSTPKAVVSATDQYRTDSDPLHDFIFQHCQEGEAYSISQDELYKAYTTFCNERMMKHFEIMSGTRFHARMSQKYGRSTSGGFTTYEGISLKVESRHLTSRQLSAVTINLAKPRDINVN